MVKGIIFDMDGLMVDSERLCFRLISKALAAQNLDHPEAFYKTTLGMNDTKTKEIYLDRYGADFDFDSLSETVALRRAESYDQAGVPLKAGLKELLAYLKKKHIPAVVASGSDHAIVEMTLAKAGIRDSIVDIVGGDEVTACKPEPEVFLEAANRLGLKPEECLVLEDSYNGLLAAQRAHIPALCIPDMIDPLEHGDVKAEGKLENLAQVIDYLENQPGQSSADQKAFAEKR